jgi:hypothetical protein
VSAILLCDSILKKGDEIVAQAYRLETRLSSKENEEIQVLSMLCCTIVQNSELPDFFHRQGDPLQRSQFFDHVPSRYNPVQRAVNRRSVN